MLGLRWRTLFPPIQIQSDGLRRPNQQVRHLLVISCRDLERALTPTRVNSMPIMSSLATASSQSLLHTSVAYHPTVLRCSFAVRCRYQIDREGSAATMLPTDALAPASTYSFLVRKDNTPRIFLHTSLSAVTAFCFYRHAPEACNAAASRATAIVQNCIARTHPIAKDLFVMACAGDLEGLVSRLQLTA